MKISLNWIKEYIPGLDIPSVEDLTKKMISTGLDIESIEDQGKTFDRFVIGEVIEKQKHPNADKLSLCKVNVGNNVINIVCGAPNVAEGQKVCVALVGAIVPNGEFEIKKSKLRGEVSEGMICSEKELNLSEKHEGILVLGAEAKPGQRFSEYINANDIVFEIGITPNRGDLNSHFGVAREIAAAYDKKFVRPEINVKESDQLTTDLINISIEDKNLCKRFTGRVITNVKIEDSPAWLQQRLKAVGLRPINNIVDITNFVMYETGQPLHAFDFDKIHGKQIIVKTAKDGETFTTLDSKERKLNSEMLMICDGSGNIGIAGVMGGENSEVTASTKNVFLESAYFDPVSIRKTSKKLSLQTDASYRFERGVDVDNVMYASLRAAALFQEIAGGEVSKQLYDIYPARFPVVEVGIRLSKANDIIGINLNEEELIGILGKIEINFLKKEGDRLVFSIPEFRRHDIEREIDLIEEVARIYGYDNIPGSTDFRVCIDSSAIYSEGKGKLLRKIKDHLIGRGFNQILTEPIVRAVKEDPETVKITGSISSEINSMRKSLLPGMLNVIKNNVNNSGKNISIKMFETGRVFSSSDKKFAEDENLIIALSGKKDSELIYGGGDDFDIFDMKGEADMLLSKLNLENFTYFYYNDVNFSAPKIGISVRDKEIGLIYKVSKSQREEFDLDNEVYVTEIYLDRIKDKLKTGTHFEPFSKFPSVKRDLAVVAGKNVKYEDLKKSIRSEAGKLLSGISIFDIYENEKIGDDNKGIAMTLEFSSDERTLKDDEITVIMDKIIRKLEKETGAKLRV